MDETSDFDAALCLGCGFKLLNCGGGKRFAKVVQSFLQAFDLKQKWLGVYLVNLLEFSPKEGEGNETSKDS